MRMLPGIVELAEVLTLGTFFGYILPKIRSRSQTAALWFCILSSSSILLLAFGIKDLVKIILSTTILYFVTRKYRKELFCPLACTAIPFVQLLIKHYDFQIIQKSHNSFDLTSFLMVYLIKCSSLAWSIYDGSQENLNPRFKLSAIKDPISPLEYFAYVLFPLDSFVGPACTFYAFRKYMTSGPPNDKLPSKKEPLTEALLTFSVFGILHVFYTSTFGSARYLLEIKNKSFLKKIIITTVIGFLERAKYYSIWGFSRISMILSGIDYIGRENGWGNLKNIIISKVETPSNIKDFFDGWNVQASVWLKECVFLRVITMGKCSHSVANIVTSLVSALWHGFYPGYYFAFISAGLITQTSLIMRTFVRPIFIKPSRLSHLKKIYDCLGTIFTILVVNYMAILFVIGRDFRAIYEYLREMNFFFHIVLSVGLVILSQKSVTNTVKNIGQSFGASYSKSKLKE